MSCAKGNNSCAWRTRATQFFYLVLWPFVYCIHFEQLILNVQLCKTWHNQWGLKKDIIIVTWLFGKVLMRVFVSFAGRPFISIGPSLSHITTLYCSNTVYSSGMHKALLRLFPFLVRLFSFHNFNRSFYSSYQCNVRVCPALPT